MLLPASTHTLGFSANTAALDALAFTTAFEPASFPSVADNVKLPTACSSTPLATSPTSFVCTVHVLAPQTVSVFGAATCISTGSPPIALPDASTTRNVIAGVTDPTGTAAVVLAPANDTVAPASPTRSA